MLLSSAQQLSPFGATVRPKSGQHTSRPPRPGVCLQTAADTHPHPVIRPGCGGIAVRGEQVEERADPKSFLGGVPEQVVSVHGVPGTAALMSRIRAVGVRAISTSTCPCPVSSVQLPPRSSATLIPAEYILARTSAREHPREKLLARDIPRSFSHVSIDRSPADPDPGSALTGSGPRQ